MRPQDQDAARRAQEASLRAMAELFERRGGTFSDAVAGQLKSYADQMRWAGSDLEDILKGDVR